MSTSIAISRCDARRRAAVTRLAAALAIMLLAVVPHLTLAASALSHGAPAATRHGDVHAAAGDCDGQPRHGHAQDRRDDAAPSAPPCCVVGCGLIAPAAAAGPAGDCLRWRMLPPGVVAAGEDAPVEPAERPPRRVG